MHTQVEGPTVLFSSKVQWSGGTCLLFQKNGSHRLRLLRKSKDAVEWPKECKAQACIVLDWKSYTLPSQCEQFILQRGTWRRMMDEWDRLVHSLDLDGAEERIYREVDELE